MELFEQMQKEGTIPNRFTLVLVLTACASLQVLEEGRCIHAKNIQRGCECEILTASLTCMSNMGA
jgi:hypothetical protein